jgi:hypothetical protein
MDDFDILFPTFKDGVQTLHEGLMIFAYFTMVLGLLFAAYRGMFGSIAEIVRTLVAIAVLSVCLNFVAEWTFELGNIVNEYVLEGLDTDPRETHTRFGELIANPVDEDDGKPWYKKMFDPQTAVAKALTSAVIWMAAKIAFVIVWWSYLIHKAIVYFGVAVSAIFLPMFLLNATRGIAIRYLMGLISLIMWPLGWAVANLMTDALLNSAADRTFYDYGGVAGAASYGPQMIFFILLAAIWLIASTIAAPLIMTRVLTTGAQIGSALLGGFAGAAVGAVSGGVGGGAVGASASAAVGGGARGGANSAAGGAMGGAAGMAAGAMGGPGAGMAMGAGMAAFSMAGGGGGSGSGGGSSSGGSGGGGSSADYNAEAATIASNASSS